MNNSRIKLVVLMGALAIIGILVIQSYWVMQTWNLKEDEFHQTVKIALLQTANDIAKQSGIVLPHASELIKQRSSNYYVVNTNYHIHAPSLEYFLGKAFTQHNLLVPFEYAIYDCSSDQMVYGNYCELTSELTSEKPKLGDLPPIDDLTYYFGVRFPTRQSYLLGQMYLSAFFTLLLLLSILFFAYAIGIILRQKRLSEMQKDFINNMTHEFKTPISTIKISADVLAGAEEVKKNNRLSQYAGIIKSQNQRLNDQVEKVLQIARVEQETFQIKKEPLDIAALVHQVLDSAEVKVLQRNGVLQRNLPSESLIVEADRHHLTNVLHNLLDNALKYCKNKPCIVVTLEKEADFLQLSIADNGIGINKKYHQQVFDKFFRVPTGNVHDVKGFGLGLFYIKHVCRLHNWIVSLDSELGEGTTIYIKMPFHKKTANCPDKAK